MTTKTQHKSAHSSVHHNPAAAESSQSQAQSSGPLLSTHERRNLNTLLRVGTAALSKGIEIVKRYPDLAPHFDVAGAQQALDYEAQTAPRIKQARTDLRALEDERLRQWQTPATQLLRLLAGVKGLAHFANDEVLRQEHTELANLVRVGRGSTRRKSNKKKKKAKTPTVSAPTSPKTAS